ncbi:MAG: VWA domain-containing protein [Gammaproteobacteria bacterium]|nr:VWA domain-containing protein [Gammaproteobacteria bacterium]
MPEALSEFQFLRPIWLVGLLALPILIWLLHRLVARASAWRDVLDNDLVEPLLVSRGRRSRLRPLPLLAAVWLLTVVALAGPTWEKAPQPIVVREDALVVILDLTWSMYATDTAPNRLTAAKRKLEDLLARRTEGMTGLITFAGDAHAVTPLTDDTETIKTLLPALKPDIMPAPGSRLAPALTLARQLFEQANVSSGRVLVITDEIRDATQARAAAQSLGGAFSLSLLVVGTSEGAPISIQTNGQSSFLKDDAGNLVLPSVDVDALSTFASDSNALISALTLGPEDLDRLLPADLELDDVFRSLDREFDLWQEFGVYLLLLIVPLAALSFRRGWVWSLVPLILFQGEPAEADWWQDLWQTKDQQGQAAFESGDAERAASLFESNRWAGASHYRAGDFAAAAEQFGARIEDADDWYNQGNALAQLGETQQAIEAYNQALAREPEHEDASFNKALLEQMQQNEQQQDQQNEEGDGDPSDQQQGSGDQSETEGEQSAPEDASQSDAEDESEQSDNAEEENPSDPGDQPEPEDEPESESAAAEAETAEEALDPEQQQAMEQWLKRVPDDPGGLLRRKFQQQFEERVRRGDITRKDFERNW